MTLPKKILAPTDFSPLAEVAVESAFALARRSQAHVHLLHVFAPVPQYEDAFGPMKIADVLESERSAARARLEHLAPEGIAFSCEIRQGFPSREIVLAAKSSKPDLIVIATHGYGVVRRALLGSVAASIVRHSDVPVLVVGEARKSTSFGHVVAAIDLSPVSNKVLDLARSYAAPGGKVTVVSVVEVPVPLLSGPLKELRSELQPSIDARRKAIHDLAPLAHAEIVEMTSPAAGILDAAGAADLVVIGTSGHNAWERAILGSTATRVLSEARCPVLVVPRAEAAGSDHHARAT